METHRTRGPSLKWEVHLFPRLSRVDSGSETDCFVQLGTQAPAGALLHPCECSQGHGRDMSCQGGKAGPSER